MASPERFKRILQLVIVRWESIFPIQVNYGFWLTELSKYSTLSNRFEDNYALDICRTSCVFTYILLVPEIFYCPFLND